MHYKNIIFSIVICCLLLFSACNNGDYNAIPSNPAGTPPSIPANISGILVSSLYSDSAQVGMQSAIAFFYPNPGDTSHTKLIGGVSVNGQPLDVDPGGAGYSLYSILQPNLNMLNTSDWTVTGDSSIPSFSFSHHVTFPIFTGVLPDSINRNSGFSITLNASNLTGADSVAVIVGMDVNSGHVYAGNYGANAGTITFTASDMVNIQQGQSIIQLIAYKKVVQTFGGKSFLFVKQTFITKPILVL